MILPNSKLASGPLLAAGAYFVVIWREGLFAVALHRRPLEFPRAHFSTKLRELGVQSPFKGSVYAFHEVEFVIFDRRALNPGSTASAHQAGDKQNEEHYKADLRSQCRHPACHAEPEPRCRQCDYQE